MSATARAPRTASAQNVYERLFREGREQVIAATRREFPTASHEDIEDATSRTLLEMVREARMTHWESGAIGVWKDRTRLRMIDEVRSQRAHRKGGPGSRVAVSADVVIEAATIPLGDAHEEIADKRESASELVEKSIGDWRVIELLATMSERAATYVRLSMLEGGARRDILAATGWSPKILSNAQKEAKAALRATLADLESGDTCDPFRDLIDAEIVGEAVDRRRRIALDAHERRCVACRAYRGEARRTVRGVIPLLGLLSGGAVPVGVAVTAGGAGAGVVATVSGAAISGTLLKGAAAICATVCIGVAAVEVPRQVRGGAPEQRESARVEAAATPTGPNGGGGQAGTAITLPGSVSGPTARGGLLPQSPTSTKRAVGPVLDTDPLGLAATARRGSKRPARGRAARRDDDALGLGATPAARRRARARRRAARDAVAVATTTTPAATPPPTPAPTPAPEPLPAQEPAASAPAPAPTPAPDTTSSCTPGELGC